MRTRYVRNLAVVGALVLAGAREAKAAGWVVLPTGQRVFMSTYTSSAIFQCSKWITLGSCSTSANAVTLSNNGASLTITWVPGPTTIMTSFRQLPAFVFGSFVMTQSGTGAFTLPTLANPAGNLFDVRLPIWLNGYPTSYTTDLYFGYRVGSPTSLAITGASTVKTIGGQRDPTTGLFGSWWFLTQPHRTIGTAPGRLDVFARTGLSTPEPATLVLMGSGLAGVAGIVRRRRQRLHPSRTQQGA